jgi:hypothetical protein
MQSVSSHSFYVYNAFGIILSCFSGRIESQDQKYHQYDATNEAKGSFGLSPDQN